MPLIITIIITIIIIIIITIIIISSIIIIIIVFISFFGCVKRLLKFSGPQEFASEAEKQLESY